MAAADILITKLFIPPTRPELVSRPRLIERLNEGVGLKQYFRRKLTLISAPAGFGKTTLVTEFLDSLKHVGGGRAQIDNRFAWLSIDKGDNDAARFLTYIIAALNRIEGIECRLGQRAAALLHSPQPQPVEAVLTVLINEIAEVTDRLILVLDDYHLIDAQSIHDALNFVISNLPPQMHIMIVTREDPDLPLPRLRARGQLTELRAMDLRFTTDEAAEFLNRVTDLELSEQDIAALERRTEGWIAGLQLAGLALQGYLRQKPTMQDPPSVQGQRQAAEFIESFTGSHRLVLDYLIEEVLNGQHREVRDFLLQTAILDRLTGDLCDAVAGVENSKSTLEMLQAANLFVIPLDVDGCWYRYHHLFADVLQARLFQEHPDHVNDLHRRASAWFERQDMPYDAIRHALAAQDFEHAADLAELAWPGWEIGYKNLQWLNWVESLPVEIVRFRPVLSAGFAWAYLNAGKLEQAEAHLMDAEKCFASKDGEQDWAQTSQSAMVVVNREEFQALPVRLLITRAYYAQAMGDFEGAVAYIEQVLDLLPEEDHYNRAALKGMLGLAYWAGGDLKAAYGIFHDGMFQNDRDLITGTFVLADMLLALGDLDQALSACRHALQLAAKYGEPMGTEDVYTELSKLHREQGDLEAASQDLIKGKQLGEQVELPDWQHRWYIAKGLLLESQADLNGSLQMLNEAQRCFVRTPVPDVRPIAAMKVRVWIKQDKLSEALAWAQGQGISFDDEFSFKREFEYLTLARLLIARYQRNRVEQTIQGAISLLARLLDTAQEKARWGSVIEILVLQALAYQTKGDEEAALKSLSDALRLAEPRGFFRIFVDEGPQMAGMLFQLLSQDAAQDYLRRLLAAFPDDNSPQVRPMTEDESGHKMIEPLSEREIEILQLIADGLTNQEIATRLYLSQNTVKAHNRNIFGKLDVNSRMQAVRRARGLGIFAAK
jgi:LuxR family maltose regulon positive regulatory protein